MTARALVYGLGLALAACGGDDGPAPRFAADYPARFVEVRGCRASADHDLRKIRILADPAALEPYRTRAAPFPAGAVVLKEEYDFADGDCAGPIVSWTVMQRRPTGTAPDRLDWAWQRVDPDREVVSEDEPRCVGCHAGCGVAPDGHDGTCAMP